VEVPLTIKQITAAALVLCASATAQAQVALTEGFDDVAALASAGWTTLNTSTSPGTTWFQGNSGIFSSASGAPDAYAAANFLGTTGLTGSVSNWLITPQLMLDPTSIVSLAARAAGGGFLDRLEVLLSTTGTAPADFTLIGSYSSSADAGWVMSSFSVPLGAATPAYVAFRYVIDDITVSGNYMGIDNVLVTAVPEPTTALLLALGLAAVAGLKLRRNAA
jgi:hypothetical protein